jgi:hypothetical protein
MDKGSFEIRVSRRLVTIGATMLLTAIIVAPTAVWAADQFTDVPDSNVFHDDIGWLADAGVTFGCNPPDNTLFCPDANVTRGQMAAFMHRLADNQVVDAASVNGVSTERFFHQAPTNTTEEEIGTYGPVTLYATCDGAGEPELSASWNATVNHMTFNGSTSAQFGNATVDADEVIGIGSGPFGSVGLAEAVSFDSHFHTSVEFFLRDTAALGEDQCFFSGFVTVSE